MPKGHDNERTVSLEKAYGAFLGAAIGDALGWPQEGYSRQAATRRSSGRINSEHAFREWEHRAGGRFAPHVELIRSGEYSDDTQLLLATARSLIYGKSWVDQFAVREVPFWLLYERGGGAALKRAANHWLRGTTPWSENLSSQERTAYFEAGGNGVAMRILPHCLIGSRDHEFARTASSILVNGIVTHGHPRALVGALAYGFGVWTAFRTHGTLAYGSMITETIAAKDVWGKLPNTLSSHPDWLKAASSTTRGQYEETWTKAVDETVSMLNACWSAMGQGALAVDQDVLHDIGCYDRSISGAGTVAAAAAIFLASRFAADPQGGLSEAASSIGADTDTIASMTGGLLGAVRGVEAFGEYVGEVQDSRYLRTMAEAVWPNDSGLENGEAKPIVPVRQADLARVVSVLEAGAPGAEVVLPEGRRARVLNSESLTPSTYKTQVVCWRLETGEDPCGQTLYVKRISRPGIRESLTGGGQESRQSATRARGQGRVGETRRVWVRLPVQDIDKSRQYYQNVIGLRVVSSSADLVNLEGAIALVPIGYREELVAKGLPLSACDRLGGAIISIGVDSLEQTFARVRSTGTGIVTPISTRLSQRYFRCLDPDSNVVEVIEVQ